MTKHGTDLIGISRIAREYCRTNSAEFEHEVRQQVLDFLINRFWFLICAIGMGVAANYMIAGPVSILFLLPATVVLMTPRLIKSVYPPALSWFWKTAATYLDTAIFAITIGFSGLWVYVYAHHLVPNAQAPVQFTLGMLSMLPLHSQFSRVIQRNLVTAFLMALTLGLYQSALLVELAYQFIGGIGVGTSLALVLFDSQRIRFYSAAIHRKMNFHFVSELERLVYDHQVRMLAEHHPIEKTMRLDEAIGYVGEFDIIESSRMQSQAGYDEFKNAIFGSCYQRLLKNYRYDAQQPQNPFSDGHIAKEMGDGFIFTVGYPFRVPPGKESAADICLQMAHDFIDSFEKQVAHFKLESSKPRCVVVLARGSLQGFWTSYKVKRYDFRQRCMTKVARFSELRRLLQQKGAVQVSGNFVLLDEGMADDLSASRRKNLHGISLEELGVQMRGYPEVKKVFVSSPEVAHKRAA